MSFREDIHLCILPVTKVGEQRIQVSLCYMGGNCLKNEANMFNHSTWKAGVGRYGWRSVWSTQ